jgi:phenylpropionate dioxygenase-like ring-hydroxylating dioxygenase large terminal subunit
VNEVRVSDGPPANQLDVAGEEALYRAMRNFWHPVMYASELDDRPHKAVLLDEELVVVRLGGEVRCFRDLCLHRGTALSLGWVEGERLRCAYHGWTYDRTGQAVDIPARPELSGHLKVQLTRYPVREKDGLIWVSLVEDPAFPIPEFPEYGDAAYRTVEVPAYDWNCSAARRIENYVDFAHFAWIHDGVLGSRERPEVPDHEVVRQGGELRFGYPDFVEPSSISKNEGLDATGEAIDSDIAYRLFMPFTVLLEQRVPDDKHYVLFFSVCPVGRRNVRNFTFMSRDYAMEEETDRKMIEFNDLVVSQDRPIVESQRPEELPVDLSAELHVRGVDAVSLDYRRWLIEIARREREVAAPAGSREG